MNEQRRQRFADLVAEHHEPRSVLIPFLQFCQEQDGYVTVEAMADAAELTGLTPGEVESVATFYSLLFMKPAGRHIIQVCRTLACMLKGADELRSHIRARLGVENGDTTADGEFTYQEVECLAACDKGPCLQHNLRYHYNVAPRDFDELLAGWRGERTPQAALPAE